MIWCKALEFFHSHGTKVIGGVQVTLGAVAANAGDFFSRKELQVLLMVSGVLTAWRGFINTRNSQ